MLYGFIVGCLIGLTLNFIVSVVLIKHYRAFAAALSVLLSDAIDALIAALSSDGSERKDAKDGQ